MEEILLLFACIDFRWSLVLSIQPTTNSFARLNECLIGDSRLKPLTQNIEWEKQVSLGHFNKRMEHKLKTN